MQPVDVSVYYLEMQSRAVRCVDAPRSDLAVVHESMPSVEYYRTLYNAVGAEYRWLSRRKLTDLELASIIHDPHDELHVLRIGGVDGGFAELDCRNSRKIEIVQFGLMPA